MNEMCALVIVALVTVTLVAKILVPVTLVTVALVTVTLVTKILVPVILVTVALVTHKSRNKLHAMQFAM